MNKQFSLEEVLTDAWALAKKNIGIIVGLTAIQFMIIFASFWLSKTAGQKDSIAFIQNILIGLLDALFTVTVYQFFFKLIDEDPKLSFPNLITHLIKAFHFILVKLIIAILLCFLVMSITTVYFFNSPAVDLKTLLDWKFLPLGMIILVPTIYFSIRLCFVLCFIVDQDSGPIESIQQSWILSKTHFWFLLLLFATILGLNLLGAIAFFVGLLFTIPFSSLMLIVAYRQMINSYTDDVKPSDQAS